MVTTYSRCFLSRIGAKLSDIKLNSDLRRNICSLAWDISSEAYTPSRAGRKQELLKTAHQNGQLRFKSSSLTNGIISSVVFENLNQANLHSSTFNTYLFPYSELISSDNHHKPYNIYQVFNNYSI